MTKNDFFSKGNVLFKICIFFCFIVKGEAGPVGRRGSNGDDGSAVRNINLFC